MAYIEKRKNGYRVQVRKRGMPSISRTFDLLADAETWAREIEREAQRGNIAVLRQDAQRMTVSEAMDRYLAGPVLTMKSAKDVRTRLIRSRERFGEYMLSNVRGVDVSAWRDDLLEDGLAPQTVIHHLNALSALFSFVEKDMSIDLPAGNPVRKVRKPAAPPARDRRLRPGEYEALQADRPELLAFIILAIETSMRRGELVKLHWEHVDLARRTAHLPDTKNGESRTVALSSLAVATLQSLPRRIDGCVWPWKTAEGFSCAWKRHVRQTRKAHVLGRLREALAREGLDAEAEIRALVYKKRQPSPRSLSLLEKIEKNDPFLTNLHFHDLRHEATSRLFEKGLGIMDVRSMTGHKTLRMLLRYTHIEAEKLAKRLG